MNRFCWVNAVVRMCLGFAAMATVSMTAQAQTYYYYPTSAPAAPSMATGANVAQPVYVQGTVGNQVTWYTYPTQTYQPTYTVQNPQTTVAPQYYQPMYQTQSVQASSDNQVAPTTYAVTNAAPVATVAADAGDPYGFLGWLNSTRASYGLASGRLRPESVKLGGDEQ